MYAFSEEELQGVWYWEGTNVYVAGKWVACGHSPEIAQRIALSVNERNDKDKMPHRETFRDKIRKLKGVR
jgi:hypothetical protein